MKLSHGDRVFEVINYGLLTLLSLVFLIPFLFILATSFVSQDEYARRGAFILIPQAIDLTAYKLLLDRGSIIINAYIVTLLRTTVGTLLNLAFTATLAYVLARRTLRGRNLMTLIVFIPMIFNGGLIPTFMLMDTLHLLNTFWVMIFPVLISPWYLFIMRNFFMGIPVELEEAAIIDGASPPVIFLRIVLPLSLPSISTIGLFYAVAHWNAWFDAAIFIRDLHKLPVQVILRGVLTQGLIQDPQSVINVVVTPPAMTLKAAMIIISTLPILCAYPFVQKYFVKGALIGSIKG